jgi:putative tricarboxylic transport membrane protein
MGIGKLNEPGPGLMPFGAGILLGILSLADLLLRNASGPEGDEIGFKGVRWSRLFLIIITLFAFTLLLPILGYLITTFLVMLFLYKCIEPQKWWVALSGAFLSTIFTYLLFAVALKSFFPEGILSFK